MSTFSRSALVAFALATVACSESGKPAPGTGTNTPVLSGNDAGGAQASRDAGSGGGSPAPTDGIARSPRPALQWKRYATFEADLSEALALPKERLCTELGTDPCVRGVHLTPLGGHDPFTTGILDSAPEPLVSTPMVVERVVLSACLARVADDAAAGDAGAAVFSDFALGEPAPAPGSEAARALVVKLYRRFLARDPDARELELVGALARDEQGTATSGATFATSACFAVGTQTEFLFL